MRLRNSNIAGKNANVYKTNFLTLNFKSTLCITFLKAKLLVKIIEINIGNKKKFVVKKKKVIMFSVFGKYPSYLTSTFSVVI